MRLAFDMAMMTAGLFQKNMDIQLWRVDQVLFLQPVDVGQILTLESRITYAEVTSQGTMMRVVTKAYIDSGAQTNNFNFMLLARPKKDATHLPKLIKPETFDEILDYHEATRRLKFEPIDI